MSTCTSLTHTHDIRALVYDVTVSSAKLLPNTLCRGLANGVYTDPFDCTMFVNCLNGFTYRRRCPPGTAWNVQIGFCDYAHKVGFQ